MAVQSLKISKGRSCTCPFTPVGAGLAPARGRSNHLKLIKNNDQSQIVASKIAFQATMERALLNQKFWDELLEKLRKMGGGGGGSGDSRFDRITISMQLMNFLSNKIILAMIKNFKLGFLNMTLNVSKQFQGTNQNIFVLGIQKFGRAIINGFANMISLIIRRDAINRVSTMATTQISTFAGILSFQLNKLKEVLEEDLKELIKKLDVKRRIKKIKNEILNIVSFFKAYVGVFTESFFVKNS